MGVTEGDFSIIIDADVILETCTIPFVIRIYRKINPRLVL